MESSNAQNATLRKSDDSWRTLEILGYNCEKKNVNFQ